MLHPLLGCFWCLGSVVDQPQTVLERMLSCLHPHVVATGPVAAHAVGRECWAELMVIKKNPFLLASSPPADQEGKLIFLQFHLLQAERLVYRAGSPVLQLVRAQCCLNCLFDNCSGCKNRGFCGEFTQGCLQLPLPFILQYYSLPSRRYS